jgi:hypothetical protein
MLERGDIRVGEKLIWQPSGLEVEVLKIGDDGAYVRAPRGGEFGVLYANLEKP